MSFAHWLPFALASAALVVIPGPTVLLVVSYALGHGRRYALATTAGVALGDVTSMTASMVGLGAMLAASATGFAVIKLIGAVYLVYLGAKLWHAPIGEPKPLDIPQTRPGKVFAHAYAVTTLNPKSIVFFVAFVPQFVDPHAPVWPQIAIFEATFVGLGTLNALCYALLASGARRAVRSHSAQRIANRMGGTMLVCAGIVAMAWKTARA
jgi:threonine/homoserine/homoserine lactone efflux protein